MSEKVVVVVSGGMDSVTLAHQLVADGYRVRGLSFDYGQRHVKELGFAKACARYLGIGWDLVDVRALGSLLGDTSSLISDAPVPDGHYAEQTMRQTIVPNRNMIMLSIASGVAVGWGANLVATAVHSGDHFIYPDCRPAFITAAEAAVNAGNDRDDFRFVTPFITLSKADIAAVGHRLGVPWEQTWSCYKGGDIHCGSCGTCFERREAFEVAGVPDPTVYLETPFYEAPA